MKKFFIPLFAALLSCSAFAADAPTLAGMPMKHSMAAQMQCSTCHDNTTEFTKPSTQKCESCHGPMAQIKTKANPQDKYPHQSAHYGNTVDFFVTEELVGDFDHAFTAHFIAVEIVADRNRIVHVFQPQ